MILKSSQRSGAAELADHLMNDRDNDHVTLYSVRGFVARDLHGALQEAHAISKGTYCTQYLFSLSLSPPKHADVSEQDLIDAVEQSEKALGLEGQPRTIVFHEKEGRRHAHAVWSRIDAGTMKAINLPHFKNKLMTVSRGLYLDHGWTLPDGMRRDGGKSPLNFTLAEWQHAKRFGLDPREIKQSFQEAWNRSDSAKGFANALKERGYFLARGDRRGFVAVDIHGEVYSVPRMLGLKTKAVKERLGDPNDLQSVNQANEHVQSKLDDKLYDFIDQVDAKHQHDMQPLHDRRKALVNQHRLERAKLKRGQSQRWKTETKQRASKLNTGIKGLWQSLSGAAAKIKTQNMKDAWESLKRDQVQRDDLVKAQMQDRRIIQGEIEALRRKYTQDKRMLARDISRSMRVNDQAEYMQEHERKRTVDRTIYRGPSLG